MTPAQLTIPLEVTAPCDFAGFETGSNGELLARLRTLALRPEPGGLWIWGGAGSGRSHLLQALCREAGERGYRAAYLPLQRLPSAAGVLEGLDADVLTLDDVELWLGDAELEATLVGVYQRQLEQSAPLVVSATVPAGRVRFALDDLASRFRALSSYRLEPLDDDALRHALAVHARRRGLILSAPTLDFWLTRSRRCLPVLLAELETLDRASLAAQRRVTIPLLKEVLGL
jgi:DnaA family protein